MSDEDIPPNQVEEESNGQEEEDVEAIEPDCTEQPLTLVSMRTLTLQETPRLDQRENIFHTRCTVKNQVLCMIIDSGSCCNIINAKVVDHLQLKTQPRATSYGLNGINDSEGPNLVTHQCLVRVAIGTYVDDIMCDVVNMECTHILLGRPWLFDRRVIYDGMLNTYSFNYDGRRVSLLPLSPQQVLQDQVRRDQARALRRAKEEKEEADSTAKAAARRSAPDASTKPSGAFQSPPERSGSNFGTTSKTGGATVWDEKRPENVPKSSKVPSNSSSSASETKTGLYPKPLERFGSNFGKIGRAHV